MTSRLPLKEQYVHVCPPGVVPERLATPLAFSLSSTWHFFLAILWRMDAFSRNFPEKEVPQR